MTILPPPTGQAPHVCQEPRRVTPPGGTLWECPECGRWWKWKPGPFEHPDVVLRFNPVLWYDIPARRRIAAHETEKWHAQLLMTLQRTTARLHWWNCHPNPNRGRP